MKQRGGAEREEQGRLGMEEQTADGCDAAASINIGRNGWKPSVLAEAPATAALIMPVEVVPYGGSWRTSQGHRIVYTCAFRSIYAV